MALPAKNNPRWKQLIGNELKITFDSLALKILLGRLNLKYKSNPSSIDSCIDELSEFFQKNSSQAKVISDIQKIFN